MQINRLFEIVYILLQRKNISAKELAEHFEVSRRTIYRDIEILSQCNIPVYTSKGKGGGIGLLENFVLSKSLLNEREQIDMLSAMQGLKATNYPEAEGILLKLSSIFGEKNINWIEVDFSDWSFVQKDKFEKIKDSIINKKVISFDYYSSYGQKTERTAEPLKLWFKERSWYLKAYCRNKQDIRIFKLMRMKNLSVTEETFQRVYKNETMEILTPQTMKYIDIELRIDRSQAYRVYDEFDEEDIRLNSDGSYTVHASYPEGEWIFGYILSFGFTAEVIEPEHIRNELKDRLLKTIKLYS